MKMSRNLTWLICSKLKIQLRLGFSFKWPKHNGMDHASHFQDSVRYFQHVPTLHFTSSISWVPQETCRMIPTCLLSEKDYWKYLSNHKRSALLARRLLSHCTLVVADFSFFRTKITGFEYEQTSNIFRICKKLKVNLWRQVCHCDKDISFYQNICFHM